MSSNQSNNKHAAVTARPARVNTTTMAF